jgi:hypothetical protein
VRVFLDLSALDGIVHQRDKLILALGVSTESCLARTIFSKIVSCTSPLHVEGTEAS